MGSTKKVKMAGRFGSRYGTKIRQRLVDVETIQRKKHKCPKCEQFKVKRLASGLFKCRKCGAKFTGGAYSPVTNAGQIITKMVQQKQFLPLMKELLEIKEVAEDEGEEISQEEEKPKKQHKKQKSKKTEEKSDVLADKVEEGLGEDESAEETGDESAEETGDESAEEVGDDSDV